MEPARTRVPKSSGMPTAALNVGNPMRLINSHRSNLPRQTKIRINFGKVNRLPCVGAWAAAKPFGPRPVEWARPRADPRSWHRWAQTPRELPGSGRGQPVRRRGDPTAARNVRSSARGYKATQKQMGLDRSAGGPERSWWYSLSPRRFRRPTAARCPYLRPCTTFPSTTPEHPKWHLVGQPG